MAPFTLFRGSTTGERRFDSLECDGKRERVQRRKFRSKTGEGTLAERGDTSTAFAARWRIRERIPRGEGAPFLGSRKATELAGRLGDRRKV